MTARIAPLAPYLGELRGSRRDAVAQVNPTDIRNLDHRPSRRQNSRALMRRRSASEGDQDGCGSASAR